MVKNKFRLKLTPSMQILLGFICLILIGALLLSLPISNIDGNWLNLTDSIFTSTSAVCVTGLIVVDTGVQFTLFGQFVIMFLIQIGGLGIVSFTSLVFLLLKKKINFSNRVAIKESLNRESVQGVVRFIKKVIAITFIIEGIGALCLLYSTITFTNSFWKGLFSAIFMSISAFCNAGFDVFGNESSQFVSLSPFAGNVLFLLPIMMLVILGGIGFVVLIDGWKNYRSNQHVKVVIWMTIILIFGGAILFMIAEWNNPLTLGNMPWWKKILNSFFQSVTTRTAGASTIDQSGLSTMGAITTMFLMFIGGSPTSIAGGIKTTTLFILLLLLIKSPNTNGHIVFNKRKISANVITKAFRTLLITGIVLLTSILIISVVEGDSFSFIEVAFECVSAMATVGLSMGITPLLTTISKFVLVMAMLIGRVGVMTILLAIASRAQNKTDDQVEYINTDIIVG